MYCCVFQHSQLTIFKISIQINHMACLAKCESTKWCCQHRDDSGTLLAHKISATQKSELFKYLKTTFSPHVRRLHAHNFRSKTRSLLNWLVSDFDSSTCQPRLSTAQNDFSNFRPGWWQFCWMTGVKFNSIHSILVRFLHITVYCVCGEEFDSFCCRFTTLSRVIEWLPYPEPCLSCQSPAAAGLGSPGDSRSHSGKKQSHSQSLNPNQQHTRRNLIEPDPEA